MSTTRPSCAWDTRRTFSSFGAGGSSRPLKGCIKFEFTATASRLRSFPTKGPSWYSRHSHNGQDLASPSSLPSFLTFLLLPLFLLPFLSLFLTPFFLPSLSFLFPSCRRLCGNLSWKNITNPTKQKETWSFVSLWPGRRNLCREDVAVTNCVSTAFIYWSYCLNMP